MSKSTAYKNNYIATHYDRINLTVPKGMKEQLGERAKADGKSINGFICDLLRQALESDAFSKSAEKTEPAKKDMDIFLF